MASTNKTAYLALNQWLGTDKPKRADFNSDNQIVDTALKNHIGSTAVHVTQAEKNKWNSAYVTGSYVGNFQTGGNGTQTITLGFQPSFGMVCCAGDIPFFHNSQNNGGETRWGVFSKQGCSAGITLNSTGFTVLQHAETPMTGKKLCLNAAGTTYLYIAFR